MSASFICDSLHTKACCRKSCETHQDCDAQPSEAACLNFLLKRGRPTPCIVFESSILANMIYIFSNKCDYLGPNLNLSGSHANPRSHRYRKCVHGVAKIQVPEQRQLTTTIFISLPHVCSVSISSKLSMQSHQSLPSQ